jgi:hypothetical protein
MIAPSAPITLTPLWAEVNRHVTGSVHDHDRSLKTTTGVAFGGPPGVTRDGAERLPEQIVPGVARSNQLSADTHP